MQICIDFIQKFTQNTIKILRYSTFSHFLFSLPSCAASSLRGSGDPLPVKPSLAMHIVGLK